MAAPVRGCHPETKVGKALVSRKEGVVGKHSKLQSGAASGSPPSLATVLTALDKAVGLSATRLRDLRSAVRCVAELLGNVPAAIPLRMEKIQQGLAAVNPIAVDMTPKRFTNIRSDFVAAVKASRLVTREGKGSNPLTPTWLSLFAHLSGKRAHLGLSRLARHASGQGIEPKEVNDEVIKGFIAAIREGSLHKNPNTLYRQVTLIWNEAARDSDLGLKPVSVPDFRGPPKRINESLLPPSFIKERNSYLAWCSVSDPFAADARGRPLAPRTLKLTKNQIHAAVTALAKSGTSPDRIQSLSDLVTVENFKNILRQRLTDAGGRQKSFDHYLARALVRIAKEWVKVDAEILAELKRLARKLPEPERKDLTPKNKRFLRQFDDPAALRRLRALPERLWLEVKSESERKPNFRTLAKAQAALAIGLLTYSPVRSENLWEAEFDAHIFLRLGPGATSTLELDAQEVKNDNSSGYDIPPHLTKMLAVYRDRIAPAIIGHRPTRLFVNVDGTPKNQATVAWLIVSYAKRRAGITLTPHQFRHLGAKLMLDANPGNFRGVQELLVHKNSRTTLMYTGINSRRASRHHQALIEKAVKRQMPKPTRQGRKDKFEKEEI